MSMRRTFPTRQRHSKGIHQFGARKSGHLRFNDDEEEEAEEEPKTRKRQAKMTAQPRLGRARIFTEKSSNAEQSRRSDSTFRHWRLIMRNLPFQTKKTDLESALAKFGPVREIVLPMCKDPRYPDSCAGFAFVQFESRKSAEMALKEVNMNEVNGRKVAVDWAVPKDSYHTAVYEQEKLAKGDIPDENEENANIDEKIKIKKSIVGTKEVKKESPDEDDGHADSEGENSELEYAESESSDESDWETNDNVSDTKKIKKEKKNKHFEDSSKDVKNDQRTDPAVSEGRTVFVRNLSFDTTDEALRGKFEGFGPVKVAIVCKYAGTEHSKGSAFVQFERRSDADRCLQSAAADEGLMLDGRRVEVLRALERRDAQKVDRDRLAKTPKDNRNLHLLRIGLVRPGTVQARNMSEADARKRANLELRMRSKLKNLNMFVSPTRLTVHNLPSSVDDSTLKSICFTAANNVDAKIVESRIWRDMTRRNSQGMAKSRGYGFVAFSDHSHALACLRALNNNPNTFTDAKRPMVEFSIENRVALNAKKARLDKSRAQSSDKIPKLNRKTKNEMAQTAILNATKREAAEGGRKPLPSHIGPKIRHRDSKNAKKKLKKNNNNNKKTSSSTAKNTKDAKKPNLKKFPAKIHKSATVNSRSKKKKLITKYLALA